MSYYLRCSKCGYGWNSPYESLPRCPYCGGVGTVSRPEPAIEKPKYDPRSNLIPGPKVQDTARKFKFTYKNIAEAKGVTIYAVRWAVKTKKLNPRDLKSICEYLGSHAGGDRRKGRNREQENTEREDEVDTRREAGTEEVELER